MSEVITTRGGHFIDPSQGLGRMIPASGGRLVEVDPYAPDPRFMEETFADDITTLWLMTKALVQRTGQFLLTPRAECFHAQEEMRA